MANLKDLIVNGPTRLNGTTTLAGDPTTDNQAATKHYVDSQIGGIPVTTVGTLGTGGTITALPVDGSANVGDTYKVIVAGTYASQDAKVGDMFICNGKTSSANTWLLIPSGDDVTSVGITQGTGITVTGGPITSSGSIEVAHSDTSSQASVTNTGRTYIQSVELDEMGHVTGLSSATETVVAPSPADTAPLMDGTGAGTGGAAIGSSTDYAREDHVHPSDTAKVTKPSSTTDNAVVRFDGGTGDIQNSSVTINDNGYLTAAKIIKSGGTSTQFLKANGDVDGNTYLTSSTIPKSNWTQETTSNASYIQNRPAVRSGNGTNSLKLNDYDNNTANGDYSTAEGVGIMNNVSFTVDDFNLIGNMSTSFVSRDFSGHVGDTFVFYDISGTTYTVTGIDGNTISFLPSITQPKSDGGEILGGASGAYGDASHVEGNGTTAFGDASHAEGESDLIYTETEIRVVFDRTQGILQNQHDYLPVQGDRFEYEGALYTVYENDRVEKFNFTPALDTIPSGAQTITVYHFESGAVGDNSHVEGLNTIALNDNEHAEGRYNVSTVAQKNINLTIHSIGIGQSSNSRCNAVEVNVRGDVFIKGVGDYDGTNMNDGTAHDLATVIRTIPSPANSGKMKISANSSSAVDTLFNANSASDTNAIKFIDGTNTQVTVTAASGSTPATVKYDFTGTIPAAQIQSDWTQTDNTHLDYIKNKPAVNTGTGANSIIEGTTTVAANANEHAEGQYNKSNTKSDGTTDENKAGTTQSSIGIGTSTNDRKNAIEVMQSGDVYINGVGGYDGTNPNASGVRTTQETISKPEALISDSTNKVTQYRGMLAKRKVYTNVLGVANGSSPNNNTWANRSIYFITLHPRDFYSQWSIRYHINVHLTDEEQTYKSSATATPVQVGQLCRGTYDCVLSGTGNAYTVYSSFNSIKNTSYRPFYYHFYHGPTQAGLELGYGYKIGVSLTDSYLPVPTADYSTGSYVVTNFGRTFEVTIDECVNCTAELNDILEIEADAYTANSTNGFKDYNPLDSTYYLPNTSYSNSAGRWTYLSAAASNGLQETGDANDVYNIYLPYTKLTAGTNGIMRNSLIMQDSSGNWQSFTTTGGESTSGTPANKTPNTATAFRPGSPIYYYSSSSSINSGTVTTGTAMVHVYLFNLKYSINAYSVTEGLPVFIKGTIHSDGYFYIDGDVNDLTVPWWTQQPSVATDGANRVYIKVSQGTYDTYRTDLISTGEMWHFDSNGDFVRYYPGTGNFEWGTW